MRKSSTTKKSPESCETPGCTNTVEVHVVTGSTGGDLAHLVTPRAFVARPLIDENQDVAMDKLLAIPGVALEFTVEPTALAAVAKVLGISKAKLSCLRTIAASAGQR